MKCKDWVSYFHENKKYGPLEIDFFSAISFQNFLIFHACVFSENAQFSSECSFNISKEEHVALKGLSTNRDLIIQKSDIGNSTVMLDKNDYIKRMIEMLSDSSIFKKVN